MKLKIKRSKKEFFFHLQATNGKILMHSENLKRKPLKLVNKLAALLHATVIDTTIKPK
jgi:hypothetical protein